MIKNVILSPDEIRIPLVRRTDSNDKPYYLAHLPDDVTILVFTQCKEPCILIKKTLQKLAKDSPAPLVSERGATEEEQLED